MKKYSIGLFALFLGCVADRGGLPVSLSTPKSGERGGQIKTGNVQAARGRGGCHSR